MSGEALAWIGLAGFSAVAALGVGVPLGLANAGRTDTRAALGLVVAVALLPVAWGAAGALAPTASALAITALVSIGRALAVARVVRGAAASELAEPWAEAAIALGVPRGRLLLRQVLPRTLAPAVSTAALGPAYVALWAGGAAAAGAPLSLAGPVSPATRAALVAGAAIAVAVALGVAVDARARAPWRRARAGAPLPRDTG
ncbi:MAG: hypothetical protein IT376_02200 [Polyangiaceae bacterium]|nr:hypothetical protein [Polyangiaceae bacterium]